MPSESSEGSWNESVLYSLTLSIALICTLLLHACSNAVEVAVGKYRNAPRSVLDYIIPGYNWCILFYRLYVKHATQPSLRQLMSNSNCVAAYRR